MEWMNEKPRPTIYLNRYSDDEKELIVLFFTKNDQVYNRIKSNHELIEFDFEKNIYFVPYSEFNLNLIKDIFSDIAIINTMYLYKRVKPEISEFNIGNSFASIKILGTFKNLYNIVLLPISVENERYVRLDYKGNSKIDGVLDNGKQYVWSDKHRSYIMHGTDKFFFDLFQDFYGIARIKLNASIKLRDATLKRIYYEQSYKQDVTYITCPDEYIESLMMRNYSENTIRIYHYMLLKYLNSFKDCTLEQINDFDNDVINRYLNLISQSEDISCSVINQSINAIKFYYKNILKQTIEVHEITRPKKPRSIPDVFSREEIERILSAIDNIKHKAMIMLLYSAGLRVSELLDLKISDILTNRSVIFVRSAKGRKDRITTLSKTALELLRKYYKKYRPKDYLFEGSYGGRYSSTSVRNVLDQAKKKAKVNKPGSCHALRHSYATHLLENGTDLRYIQSLLGHNSSKTTEIYTYVSNSYLENITSPGDLLNL